MTLIEQALRKKNPIFPYKIPLREKKPNFILKMYINNQVNYQKISENCLQY